MKDLLTSDHRDVDAILASLFAAFERKDAEEVGRLLDYFWARLAAHIRAEDSHLFPAVLRAFGSRTEGEPTFELVESSILHLDNDHRFFNRELGAAVKELFDMREDGPENRTKRLDALRAKLEVVFSRLELHNREEEAGVYRWAKTLGEDEATSLNAKIHQELTNLPQRFRKAGNQRMR